MARVYTIFYDNDSIYFPVKTKNTPYQPVQPAYYCADMPVFFGGKTNRGETELSALKREVNEESQGHYQLTQNFTFNSGSDTKVLDEKDFKFYMIKIDHASNPLQINNLNYNEGIFNLDETEDTPPERREDHCLIRFLRTSLPDSDAETKLNRIIAFCREKNCCSVDSGIQDFNNSHTKQAFLNILARL